MCASAGWRRTRIACRRRERLILGDMRETLPALHDRLGGRVVLAHFDVGTGDAAANLAIAAELTPQIVPLLAPAACWSRPADRCRRTCSAAAARRHRPCRITYIGGYKTLSTA